MNENFKKRVVRYYKFRLSLVLRTFLFYHYSVSLLGPPIDFPECGNCLFLLREFGNYVFLLREIVKWLFRVQFKWVISIAWNCELWFFLAWKREHTAPKTKFSIKDFFSKCDQIRRKLRVWLHLLKKSLMKNFIFCAVTFVLLLPVSKNLVSFLSRTIKTTFFH